MKSGLGHYILFNMRKSVYMILKTSTLLAFSSFISLLSKSSRKQRIDKIGVPGEVSLIFDLKVVDLKSWIDLKQMYQRLSCLIDLTISWEVYYV